jgi:sulfide:quinone oxidoreductase
MMEIRPVYSGFAVAEQLQVDDLETLAKAGFVAVICNRPDDEEQGQPTAAEVRAAAQDAGLSFHHIPVSGGQFPAPAVAAFGAVRKGTEGPVLAYCRTGTRSITLEMLANPNDLAVSERVKRAEIAGYDLGQMSAKLI